ncbi:hypothetical protein PEPS_20730 [Persicobacter psychrovividus]|uniref:Cytochrome C oxidase subunit IV n=2 Tax=Persicobacter psychrovividus TaxID=387638 RepID=A0ABN6L994_9BACT|nr:hypothetical protein PEPS_20730 [Persicobacter psychrovividus]
METTNNNIQVQPADPAKIKKIWKVAGILALITAVEFVIAFTVSSGMPRNSLFILLTLWKAFYIVSEFMHLKHEHKVLIWSLGLPVVFIIWLVIALLNEGSAIFSYFVG